MPKYDPMFMDHFKEGVTPYASPLERVGQIVAAANMVAKTSKVAVPVNFQDACAGFRLALTLFRAQPEAMGALAGQVDATEPNIIELQIVTVCSAVLQMQLREIDAMRESEPMASFPKVIPNEQKT